MSPRVIIFIQARMGSTRLPGKVMKEVVDKPLISYEIERLKRVTRVQGLAVVTTTQPQDQVLVDLCRQEDVPVFRGSEEDVLKRFHEAAHFFSAEVIVRFSGDCPLIDPAVTDQAIESFLTSDPPYDYLSNTLLRTFPRGLDVEVFSIGSLDRVEREAHLPGEREHVTPYYYQHPHLFCLGSLTYPIDYSSYRWTVDTPEDFVLIEKILREIYPSKPEFTWLDVIEIFAKHPQWLEINAHVKQKSV
jgi:spore coat polysaccharide biosynthesis protein SpsF